MTDICISCDRGGTFSDLCAEYTTTTEPHQRKRMIMKLLSVNPQHYPDAAVEGIRRLLEQITGKSFPKGQPIPNDAPLTTVRLGTTVATNALLERAGNDVIFVTTQGLEDVIEIGTQARPNIFALDVKKPLKLYTKLISAPERVLVVPNADTYVTLNDITSTFPRARITTGSNGEKVVILQPLDLDAVKRQLQEAYIPEKKSSIAIALAHSYAFPDHELQIAQLAKEIGYKHISTSSQLTSSVKLLSRAHTACADAYLTPILREYVNNFLLGFDDQLKKRLDIKFMQSDGGLVDAQGFSGIGALLSGPAGGYLGYTETAVVVDPENSSIIPQKDQMLKLANQCLSKNAPIVLESTPSLEQVIGTNVPALAIDIGGTSSDISVSWGQGKTKDMIFQNVIAGVQVVAPSLNISTLATGGGSILHFDDHNGVLSVGPQSAGSYPGPACYAQTPDAPFLAITDANCVIGKLQPDHFPSIFGPKQDEKLNKKIADDKFEAMVKQVNNWRVANSNQQAEDIELITKEELALGFLSLAYEQIARGARALTESRGLDSREFTLALFGGTGGQLAPIADNLGITTIHIHSLSSILSAYGIHRAPVSEELSKVVNIYLDDHKHIDIVMKLYEQLKDNVAGVLLTHGGIQSADFINTSLYLSIKYETTDTALMVEITTPMLRRFLSGDITGMITSIQNAFFELYRVEFGFVLQRQCIIESIRVRCEGKNPVLDLTFDDSAPKHQPKPIDHRSLYLSIDSSDQSKGKWYNNVPLYKRLQLSPGTVLPGPCFVIDETSTIIVEPKWAGFILHDSVVLIKDPVETGQMKPDAVVTGVVGFGSSTTHKNDDEKEDIDQSSTTIPAARTAKGLEKALKQIERDESNTIQQDVEQSLAETKNIDKLTFCEKLTVLSYSDAVSQFPCEPVLLSLYTNRFMAIVEQMCQILQRTSTSVNIKQRLDFSCALFTQNGDLVQSGPNLPVHLGSLSTAVKAQIDLINDPTNPYGGWNDGDVIVTNDPRLGGSHLPDITVVSPVCAPFELFPEELQEQIRQHPHSTCYPLFFLVARGHHSELGGIAPASMPSYSRLLCEEGVVISSYKIVQGVGSKLASTLAEQGERIDLSQPYFDEKGFTALLLRPSPCGHPECVGSRNIYDNLNDLRAQIAANNRGIRLIKQLVIDQGVNKIISYMFHIQNTSEQSARELLKNAAKVYFNQQKRAKLTQSPHQSPQQPTSPSQLPEIVNFPPTIDYMDDGTAIQLQVSINTETGNATFDFSGTGPNVLGNTNAPLSVVRSAIIYCIRVMVEHNATHQAQLQAQNDSKTKSKVHNTNIPLNQGLLIPVHIVIPPNTLLSPHPKLGVVGGNVLTSQRITDVILYAFQIAANSSGCMNNFSFGSKDNKPTGSEPEPQQNNPFADDYQRSTPQLSNTIPDYGFYETICGGYGATAFNNGVSATHCHMTNTLITDSEILERKYPVLLRRFHIREGSAGVGHMCGGEGVLREVQFLNDTIHVNILSERRSRQPNGICGGGDAKPGVNLRVQYTNPSTTQASSNPVSLLLQQYESAPSFDAAPSVGSAGLDYIYDLTDSDKIFTNLGGKNQFKCLDRTYGIRIITPGGAGFGLASNCTQNQSHQSFDDIVEIGRENTHIGSVAQFKYTQDLQ